MDNNELIPTISDDISENSVLVVKRKKKRKKHFFFKRLLCFVLIMGLCYFVYRNLNEIKGHFATEDGYKWLGKD